MQEGLALRNERWRSDRLDTRLAQGRLDAGLLRGVAAQLARRHLEAEPVGAIAARASVSRLPQEVGALRDRLLARGHDLGLVTDACARLERLVASDRTRFEARAASGAFRPIHGALDPSEVFVDAGARASIETPAELAVGDPVCDVARLAVELRRARRSDLAERFVAAYAEAADDFALYTLLGFHESLVALALAADARDADDALRWIAIAQPPRAVSRPQLVAVGGRAASGKSTVARRLAAELRAPVISAHALREPASDDWSTVLELARRAEPVLDAGRSVVLDATFASQASRRAAARIARERGAPFLFTECCAVESARRRRLTSRRAPTAPTPDWEPVRDLEGGVHVVMDTSRAEPRGFARVRRILPAVSSRVA